MSSIPHYRTILYASDLGTHTRPVFRHAVSLAQQYGARIVMLHVVEPLGNTGRAVLRTYLPELDLKQLERNGLRDLLATMRTRLERFCEEEASCGDGAGLVSDLEVAMGLPSEEILKTATAHKADLIVIGSTTHTLFGRHGLGSTARKVSHHAAVPVLVVPNA